MAKTSFIASFLCMFVVAGTVAACSSKVLPPTPMLTESPLPLPAKSSPIPEFQSPIQATQPTVAAPMPTQAPSAPIVPIPEVGKAAVSGILYNLASSSPIPGTVFYLTPATGEGKKDPPLVFVGPQKEKGDIQGMSDAQGRVLLNNIPPGNYYLAVWAPYKWILAVQSATDETPRLIVLKPDQVADLGDLSLYWP